MIPMHPWADKGEGYSKFEKKKEKNNPKRSSHRTKEKKKSLQKRCMVTNLPFERDVRARRRGPRPLAGGGFFSKEKKGT